MSANGTLAEDKMLIFKGECAHFSLYKRHIYTHDGASYKFSTNSHETVPCQSKWEAAVQMGHLLKINCVDSRVNVHIVAL